MTIDKDKLRELASDPKNKSKDIRAALGFKNDAALHYALNKDDEAKRIYSERASATKSNGDSSEKASARAPRRKAAKRAAPPRKTNAKPAVSDELLRRVAFEMESISLYEEKTDRFDEVLAQLKAAIK